MSFLFEVSGESGPAADTGSAVHAAIAAWHLCGHDVGSAVESMVARYGEFPLADLEEATSLFCLYTRDPRNREAEVVAVERRVEFLLPACAEDPTGEAISVIGTVDQVRREGPLLKLYDIKTSKRPGHELLDAHLYQLAAYTVGASHAFGEPVHPGALICPRHYRGEPESAPDGVFFECAWTFDDARFILWGVRRIVAAVRAGEVWHFGGAHCRYCVAGSPDVCVPRLRASTDPKTMKISLPTVPAQLGTFGQPIEL